MKLFIVSILLVSELFAQSYLPHRRKAFREFSPFAYGTPIVWFAARKETSYSDGSTVGTWTDWSGNGFHATQATEANKPTFETGEVNGKPVIRFDGATDYLSASFTSSDPMTTFVVWKSANPTKFYQRIIDSSADKSVIAASGGVSTAGASLFSGTVLAASFSTSSYMVMTCVHDGSSSFIYVNGTQVATGSTGAGTASSFIIGALNTSLTIQNLQGDLAELLPYNAALSTGNRQAVEDALGSIYGITITH